MPANDKNDEVKNEARPVGDIAEPAKAVPSNASVKAALDEMKARETESSLVTDERGELVGAVSKDGMNRKVGGLGHDPKTESVGGQVETPVADCFEDQTVGEAKKIMLEAKVPEVAVVTRDKVLVGTTNLEAIAQAEDEKKKESNETLDEPNGWLLTSCRAAFDSISRRVRSIRHLGIYW
jgi:CBS domain-containing protein